MRPVQVLYCQEFSHGEGQESLHSPKDVLFVKLEVRKHGGQWDFLVKMFDIKISAFERFILNYIRKIMDAFYENYVNFHASKDTMTTMKEDKTEFKNYSMALYATDATFQQADLSSGSLGKANFISVRSTDSTDTRLKFPFLSNGMAIWSSYQEPGSKHDFKMLQEMSWLHKKMRLNWAMRNTGMKTDR